MIISDDEELDNFDFDQLDRLNTAEEEDVSL